MLNSQFWFEGAYCALKLLWSTLLHSVIGVSHICDEILQYTSFLANDQNNVMNIRKLTTRQLLEQVWLDLLKAANFRMRNYRVNTDLTVCLFIGLYTSSLFVCLLSNLYAYIY